MTPSRPNSTRCQHGRAFAIFCEMLTQETNDCIVWPYAKDNYSDFGIVSLGRNGAKKYAERAHNLAWVMTHKEQIGPAYIVRHLCAAPNCFNPRHLEKDESIHKKGQGLALLLKLSNLNTDACVLWPYSTPHGRGRAVWEGQRTSTNRAAWLANGRPIERSHVVCHTCDNPSCVNLKHLFAGTQRENVEDCIRKGRNTVLRGVQKPMAALTEAKVKEARFMYLPRSREWGARSLARRYGVSTTTMTKMLKGETWKHLL